MKKRFDPDKAQQLAAAINRAHVAQQDYLEQHFPVGHLCDVLVNARQKKPSAAKIFRVDHGGVIAIELVDAKPFSRNRIRRLMPGQVQNVRPAEKGIV